MLGAVREPTLWVSSERKRRRPRRGAPDDVGAKFVPPFCAGFPRSRAVLCFQGCDSLHMWPPGTLLVHCSAVRPPPSHSLASPALLQRPHHEHPHLANHSQSPVARGSPFLPSMVLTVPQAPGQPCALGVQAGDQSTLGMQSSGGLPMGPSQESEGWARSGPRARAGSRCGLRPGGSCCAGWFVCPRQAMQLPATDGISLPDRGDMACIG